MFRSMDWFIKAFIRASLLWFAAGIVLGIGMAIDPAWIVYRPAHAHMNVAGFLTMLVFGVGYQLLPRLFGHPLYSTRLAVLHLFLANLGLLGLVVGFLWQPHDAAVGHWIVVSGGVLGLESVADVRCSRCPPAQPSSRRTAFVTDDPGISKASGVRLALGDVFQRI
jgi:hypothetical protein